MNDFMMSTIVHTNTTTPYMSIEKINDFILCDSLVVAMNNTEVQQTSTQ